MSYRDRQRSASTASRRSTEKSRLKPWATRLRLRPDHYSVIARMVEAVSKDPAQLRIVVYEFARLKLKQQLYRELEEGGWPQVEERVHALESAINRVEGDFAHGVSPPKQLSEAASADGTKGQSTNSSLVVRSDYQNELSPEGETDPDLSAFFSPSSYRTEHLLTLVAESGEDTRAAVAQLSKLTRANFWWTIQLAAAVVIGLVIYSAIDWPTTVLLFGPHRFAASANSSKAASANSYSNGGQAAALSANQATVGSAVGRKPAFPGLPIPSSYGVYAVSNGQLTELDVLPIRVPDPRIAISPTISTASQAHVASGRLQFVVFRRDLATEAPERVVIRVVAQIMRALTFDPAGKAAVTKIDKTWVVRSNSYQMRVAPMPDNPDMIVIQPDPADLVLPAGRYALVLKGAAYDFTVDGLLTDAAHCLERTDALNAPIYTECRGP